MTNYSKKANYKPLLWFIIGFGAFAFTRVSTYIPFAIVLAALFILRFLRTQKAVKGILLAALGFPLTIILSQFFPVNGPWIFIIGSLISFILKGLIFMVPYMVDRLIFKKIKGFYATLVFPVFAIAFYFLNSTYGLFKGTAFFYAFTQYGNLSLVQFLSVAGIWGSGFFLLWTASVINWMWENEFAWINIKKGVTIYAGAALLIFTYGGFRISPLFYDYTGKTVKVASVLMPADPDGNYPSLMELFPGRVFSDLNENVAIIEERVEQAAYAEAKIVVFQEYSLLIPEIQEASLIKELKRIAIENNIYICINYAYLPEMDEGEHEYTFGFIELSDEEEGSNKALLINNQGEMEIEYVKHHLVKGEDNYILEGTSDQLPVVDTPYGRVGVVICKDMEFSRFMRQAAEKRADIVLAPSFESSHSLAITYSQMLRAVEYGFSFVRPCANGLSIAIDYQGRVLTSLNSFTSPGEIMYAEVPTKGVSTLYGFIGDLFAWLCCLALAAFVVLGLLKRKGIRDSD